MQSRRVELVEKFPRNLNVGANDIEYRVLYELWAGYGSLFEVFLGKEHTIICKEIVPSFNDSVGHQRKMKSYLVEAALYQHFSADLRRVLSMAELLDMSCGSDGDVVLLLSDLRNDFPNKVQKLHMLSDEIRVALDWLVKFHTYFWTCDSQYTHQLWPEGGYWYLATRQEEYSCIPQTWRVLQHLAPIVSDLMTKCKHQTIIHGDYKCPNILLSSDRRRCAVVDFQYTGRGLCTRDIVMLLASSADFQHGTHEQCLATEEEYLSYYYFALSQHAQSRFSRRHLQQQYDLALLDYARFMAGWGWWGNVAYVQGKVNTIIDQLIAAQCRILQKDEVLIDELDSRPFAMVFPDLCETT